MLEPISIPILMRAVDFLFDEASKILQERRERRKKELNSKQSGSKSSETPENAICSKEMALVTPIDPILWSDLEAEVNHLLSLLDVYTKNYRLAKEQYAKFGSAMVPPVIVHNLAEAEDGIADTIGKLQETLSKVYGRDIVISMGQ